MNIIIFRGKEMVEHIYESREVLKLSHDQKWRIIWIGIIQILISFFFFKTQRWSPRLSRNMQLAVHLQWRVLPGLGWAYPTKDNWTGSASLSVGGYRLSRWKAIHQILQLLCLTNSLLFIFYNFTVSACTWYSWNTGYGPITQGTHRHCMFPEHRLQLQPNSKYLRGC